ncbi:MAG TPA: hypothetical protein VF495_17300 [Phenylobacterium sp.]
MAIVEAVFTAPSFAGAAIAAAPAQAAAGVALAKPPADDAPAAASVLAAYPSPGGQALATVGGVSPGRSGGRVRRAAQAALGGFNILFGQQRRAARPTLCGDALGQWQAGPEDDLTGAFVCAGAGVRPLRTGTRNAAAPRAMSLFSASVHAAMHLYPGFTHGG